MSILSKIRTKYRPLYVLRKLPAFRWLLSRLDRQMMVHLPDIGFPIFVSLAKDLTTVVSGGRIEEEAERKNLKQVLAGRDIAEMWDVGANVGLYGFTFATMYPKARIVMFEPDPSNFSLLQRTLQGSGLTTVTLDPRAAWKTDGQMALQLDSVTGKTGSIVLNRVTSSYGARSESIMVDTVRLDSVAGKPDFIKIDVEGAEPEVFEGARRTIEENLPIVMFEALERTDEVFDEIRDWLSGLGYRVLDLVTLEAKRGGNNIALPPGFVLREQ